MKIKLSVNVLTWNTMDTLHDSIHVLREELTGQNAELIIVDNGSNDGCETFASIKNPVNLGISVGKNQGIKASKGDYILLLDGDILPVPNSIRLLVKYLDEHPEVDALGFYGNKFSNQKNKHQQKHHEDFCNQLVDVVEHTNHCVYYGIYRRKIFDAGVMFDEKFEAGYGYEDLDFYLQMKKAGFKQYVCHINHAGGRYYHAVNSSIRNMGFEKYMETEKARSKIFIEKWGDVRVSGRC
jgi:glycosyltransferase involved in cell wall biosynthesis